MLKFIDRLMMLCIFIWRRLGACLLTPVFHYLADIIDKFLNRYTLYDEGWDNMITHRKISERFEKIKMPFVVSLVVSIGTQIVVHLMFG